MTADSEPSVSPPVDTLPVDALPVDAPPGDPFAPIVERPRLRIAHLMFWTACVAVYLSMIRMLQEIDPDTSTVFRNVWMLYGLGAGTGLAGLLVGVAWRFRGMPFPVTGGEYVLVMTGIGPLVSLAAMAAYRYLDPSLSMFGFIAMATGVLCASIWCWAAIRTRVRRWRVYFVLEAISDLVGQTCLAAAMHAMLGQNVFFLLLLVYVAARDWLEHWRKPWTHWLGVAAQLWFGVYISAWRAAMIWFPEWLGLP